MISELWKSQNHNTEPEAVHRFVKLCWWLVPVSASGDNHHYYYIFLLVIVLELQRKKITKEIDVVNDYIN